MNRHVGSRSGEMVCRYSWMTKTAARTSAPVGLLTGKPRV
ncbi:hypothetical protein MPHL43072_01515 [Mycolicibacterium phlei DSM 43072]|uniref:Uncharacterized protein n=1 Tax=Mycolicibacterium phlei DSM 43239 = CCUG 21000 TaxID=1226750 RepID=A0A5N5UZ02_MYCPH|nr:hypothetical protein MPHL21000_15855 [Mycolicibacterium phlei DSM 43239 = CCUG 21000]KXW65481.1 hypothetical protein MPHL43239_11675 [Mycolicibacterium phlei DSM 43239 = CCUG 21000]KXW71656.1 hypothetical protein MPHL43070_16110 [Mycolicibacterium phlei DSM 43070]KXW72483.1 hypothetical protein MPHL43072_01515 [Mycolicibacterium phlei DSM 43072]